MNPLTLMRLVHKIADGSHRKCPFGPDALAEFLEVDKHNIYRSLKWNSKTR